MSVAYILNSSYSNILNEKLNQELEVSTSLKAPVHIIDSGISISKNSETGAMVLDSDVVEAVVIQTDSVNAVSGVFTSALNSLVGDTTNTVSVNADYLDMNGVCGIKSLSSLTISGSTPEAGYVLSCSDPETGSLAWVPDATADVSQWATYKAVSNVDMSQNSINNAYSVSSTFVKADVLDTATPSSTQINVAKNLNLSSNILYAQTINAGNTITALTTRFGVEPNRFSGADSYTLSQVDGDNRVVSESAADLAGFHDVQSKRGKFYATNASDEEKFTATGDGSVSCVDITTSKLNIPTLTPTVGQVLAASSIDGSLYWKNDADNQGLASVLDISNNAQGKNITNLDTLYTNKIFSNNSSGIVAYLGNNGGTFQISSGDMNLGNNNLFGGDKITTHSINTSDIYEELLGSGITFNNNINMSNNDINNVSNITVSSIITTPEIDGTAGGNLAIYPAVGYEAIIYGNSRISGGNLTVGGGSLLVEETVSCSQLNPTYKPERTLWVSGTNSNSSPNGSYENPFSGANGIQDAINYAESLYNNTYWYINVLAGTYAGFTVSKKVFIKGCAASNPDSASVGCQIIGDINVNIDSNDGDMFNNMFSLSGFLVAGAKLVDGSTARHVVNITDCYFYNDSGTGRTIDCRPTATDMRLQIFNSKIINTSPSGGDPMVELSTGMAKFYQSQFQCSGVQNVVKFSGNSRVDSIVLCSFTSTTNSPNAPAIVEITSTTTSGFTFGNCSFIYANPTPKANAYSTGIYANAPNTTTITVLYNTFSLLGTSDPTNHVINYNTNACTVYFFSNGAIPTTASRINGNKVSLQAVA